MTHPSPASGPTPPSGPAAPSEYGITRIYVLSEDAWHLELDHRDERRLLTAVIPDEDPRREPSFRLGRPGRHHEVPYEVVRGFMAEVAEEVERCRAWTRLPPAAVDAVVRLREVVYDGWGDEDRPALLALLSQTLPPDQVAAVASEVLGVGHAEVLADLAAPPATTARDVAALRERMAEAGRASGTTDG
ncbi:hypothetical protein [Streptomyces sp. DH12]|uniref:hypothetical protein n=1 Tax=Streptomyces sp. DH12 TaxID=2857010 RepID=UPI001E381EA7|nr:hypothetical protein [Streptomyces sp. DH12]